MVTLGIGIDSGVFVISAVTKNGDNSDVGNDIVDGGGDVRKKKKVVFFKKVKSALSITCVFIQKEILLEKRNEN